MSEPTGFRRAWAVPSYRRMLGSYAVSRTGDFLFSTALVVVVFKLTGSPVWVSLLWVVRLVPYVLLPPFAGVLADRMDRRKLMITTDVLRAAVMVGFAVLVGTGAPVWTLLVLSAVTGIVGSPFLSAFLASLPEVLDEDSLGPANSLITTVEQSATVVGPLLAAGVLLVGLDAVPFALNAVTFLASAALLAGVRIGTAEPAARDRVEVGAPGPRLSFLADLRGGVDVIRDNSVVLLSVLVTAAVTFAYGMELVLLPLVSRDLLGTGEAGVGILEASAGIGGVIGALVAVRFTRVRRVLTVFGVIAVVMVIPIALFSVVRVPGVAWALMGIEGAATALLDVMLLTTLQRVVPVTKLARVDGLMTSLLVLATLAGTVVVTPLLAVFSLPAVLLIAAGVSATGGLLLIVRSVRPLPEPAVDPEVDALVRRIPAFDGLPGQAVRALASAGVRDEVVAGTVLLRQGETADAVLLLASGACSVTGTGPDGADVELAVVGAPDLLGEIGVLQGRPRSATVTATEACVVWRIPATVFVAAVTGDVTAPLALSRSIETRLARWPG